MRTRTSSTNAKNRLYNVYKKCSVVERLILMSKLKVVVPTCCEMRDVRTLRDREEDKNRKPRKDT